MAIRLSKYVERLNDSATLAVAEKARKLRAAGVDVVAFGAGEPDFDTPQHIKDAAVKALAAGDTKYTNPVSGKTALREAICDYTRKYGGVDYKPEQVCVAAGGKDALHLGFAAVLDPGDEVVLPVPYWVSFPEHVKMAGATPVYVQGDRQRGGKITPAQLSAAITPRTRAFVINSPSNPTGAAYSREELLEFAGVLRDTQVLVFSDEIYHRLAFAEPVATSFAALPGMYERTVTFNSASKTYAMTGWRIGWACGPELIIRGMSRITSQTTSGATSFVQTALVAALNGDQACVEEMRQAYRRRCDVMHGGLLRLRGFSCPRPDGAYYCFPDVSKTFTSLGVVDASGFAEAVLERAHVALVPGNAFGWDTHVRLSFATSEAQIEEGLRRLGKLFGA